MTDPKPTTDQPEDPPTEEIDTNTQRIGRGKISYRKAHRSVLETPKEERPSDSGDG